MKKIILLFLFTTTLAFSQEKVSLDAIENYIGKEITVCEVVKSTLQIDWTNKEDAKAAIRLAVKKELRGKISILRVEYYTARNH